MCFNVWTFQCHFDLNSSQQHYSHHIGFQSLSSFLFVYCSIIAEKSINLWKMLIVLVKSSFAFRLSNFISQKSHFPWSRMIHDSYVFVFMCAFVNVSHAINKTNCVLFVVFISEKEKKNTIEICVNKGVSFRHTKLFVVLKNKKKISQDWKLIRNSFTLKISFFVYRMYTQPVRLMITWGRRCENVFFLLYGC